MVEEIIKETKIGRPSKYGIVDPKAVASIVGKLGGTDAQLAVALGVSEQSLNTWKKDHEDLLETLKNSKELADSQVEKSLFQRAIGYSHKSEKIFCTKDGEIIRAETVEHYPPDTTACIYWTKNRRPDLWRDVQRLEHTGKDGGKIEIEHCSADDLRNELLKIGAIDVGGRLVIEN